MPRAPKPPLRIVYNVDGTARRKCRCDPGPKTWLAHWQRKTGRALPIKCYATRCPNPTAVGAHVRLEGGDRRVPLIIPFCQFHNKRPSSQPIPIKAEATFCRASMSRCIR